MPIINLIQFAKSKGIKLADQESIAKEAVANITARYSYSVSEVKENFDELLSETEQEIYKIYLAHEKIYGEKVMNFLVDYLIKEENLNIKNMGLILGNYFNVLDKFFLSLAQSRKSRVGKTFEGIHNALFKQLGYPFDEQIVINGKPDFLMPSRQHYMKNPMDCIIFTAKRTLRERWRQIVTEGTRGLGFYLATIDHKVSSNQLEEMLHNRIYLVCPAGIKEKNYPDAVNVLNFKEFFKLHLDPAMIRWKQGKVIL